jgi:tetratricopeptide (TPR) repeat protein
MVKARAGVGLIVGCWLLGATTAGTAAPTVAEMLAENFRPKQDGVNYATPAPADYGKYKVELVQLKRGNGWALLDANGRLVRRYLDTNGDKHVDVWSYYQDGVEVYREIDSTYKGKTDQYRWLNAGGSRWAIDYNGDGKIDAWKMISPEEVSQEVLQAVLTKDLTRLQALWVSEDELKALGFPAAEITRVRDLQKQAPAKFQAACSKLAGLGPQTRWVRLETATPQCLPADQTGAKQDVYKHQRATIFCDDNGKTEMIQTGELIQVGLAWRLVEAPSPGDVTPTTGETANARPVDPAVQKLLDDLRALDAKAPQGQEAGPNPEIVRYNLQRADLLGQVVEKVSKPEDRDPWCRQVADCLNAAAQASAKDDKAAYQRLQQFASQLAKDQPGTALAGYVTFREMQADYAMKLGGGGDPSKVQGEWLERLAQFIQTYPKADDSADALLQLGMVSEFMGKETEAKKWYQQLAKNYPDKKALADKAQGALQRLELDGKVLELAGPGLDGGSHDIARLRGKAVVVYYWASWNQQCVGDFAKLKLLMNTYGDKGLDLLCVNLDNSAEEAVAFLKRSPAPGAHLYQPGGLDSPLATQYGVMVLPNLFLVGKDGKLVSRSVQMNTLEDEVKKLLK